MATVDILIPTKSGLKADTHTQLQLMVRESNCRCGTHAPWLCDQGKHSVRVNPSPMGSSIVHWSRNKVVTLAMYGMDEKQFPGRPQPDFFLLMDDDMVAEPYFLNRLLSWDKSMVTGISTIRKDPPQPNILRFLPEQGRYEKITKWDWDSNALFEVDAVGAAFFLVRRSVFEAVGKSYLDCKFEIEADLAKYPQNHKDVKQYWALRKIDRHTRFRNATTGHDPDWAEADCWWFQFLPNGQFGEMGEDVSFCWKAQKLGFKIWADPQVLPGHIGEYAYSVRDHRGYVELQEAAIEQAVVNVNS